MLSSVKLCHQEMKDVGILQKLISLLHLHIPVDMKHEVQVEMLKFWVSLRYGVLSERTYGKSG